MSTEGYSLFLPAQWDVFGATQAEAVLDFATLDLDLLLLSLTLLSLLLVSSC